MPYKPNLTKSYVPLDTGLWPAICVAVVDLGTSEDTYKGETNMRAKVAVGWEIHAARSDEEAKELVWKIFTSSLHEKATLRKWLESWRGRKFTQNELIAFDFYKMVGASCQLNLIHIEKDDNIKAILDSVLPYKGQKLKSEHPHWFFSFQDPEPDMNVFNSLPDFMKDIIKRSNEWKFREDYPNTTKETEENDDIPF